MAQLPKGEHTDWQTHWAEVEALRKQFTSLPAAEQVEEVRKELMNRNPKFDGKLEHKTDGGVVTELSFGNGNNVTDLSPVRALLRLKVLNCDGGPLSDLAPLKSMKLTSLNLPGTRVQNLLPLKGMPLTSLNFHMCTQIHDLTPLEGMRLTSLNLHDGPKVQDLTPLKGMPLTYLSLNSCPVRDLSLLQGMPLTTLILSHCHQVQDLSVLKGLSLTTLFVDDTQVRDLEPLKGMPLKRVYIYAPGVTDVTPLKGMQLEDIRLTPKNITEGLDILRDMKSLKTIGLTHYQFWPAERFWRSTSPKTTPSALPSPRSATTLRNSPSPPGCGRRRWKPIRSSATTVRRCTARAPPAPRPWLSPGKARTSRRSTTRRKRSSAGRRSTG